MRNKIYKLSLFIFKLGLIEGITIVTKMFFGKKGEEIHLKLSNLAHPVTIRAQTSDEYTFQQIFVENQYAFKYNGNLSKIIDAGANIGLAAIYFANRFPSSKIICIEPEAKNFELLKKNIALYPQIKALQKGLWSSNTFLKIIDSGLDNWGFSVEESDKTESGSIEAISIPGIMEEFKMDTIDLLKMDIEGSEKNIFENQNSNEWISKCKILIIELHDRMTPGSSEIFFQKILENVPFQIEIKGENLVCEFLNKR